jgi:DNA invertase Pin-like site-specific DNA recombinase
MSASPRFKQVLTNTESALRQYDLRGRAIAFGWSSEQIIVIDTGQGHSGASAADREGFQRLVAGVGMGKAGIVLGLECSRLARNNADWHRLPGDLRPVRHADLRRRRPL